MVAPQGQEPNNSSGRGEERGGQFSLLKKHVRREGENKTKYTRKKEAK
jgi:hypothetical protein